MSIPVTCSCGKSFGARLDLAGKTMQCPSCGQPLQIPVTHQQPVSQPPDGNPLPGAGNSFNQQQLQSSGFSSQPSQQFNFGEPQPVKKRKNWKFPLFIGIGVVAAGAGLTVVTIVALNTLGRVNTNGAKYDSPEEVANAYYRARIDGDVETLYYCLTPEARRSLIAGRILVMAEMANNPKHPNVVIAAERDGVDLSDLTERMAKYRIDLSQLRQTTIETKTVADYERAYEMADRVKNPLGFLRECQELPGLIVAYDHRDTPPVVENVKVTGDTATADVRFTYPDSVSQDLRYRRIDGSWLFDARTHFQSEWDKLRQLDN